MSFNLSVCFVPSPKGCWGNAPSNEIEKFKLSRKRLVLKVTKIQRKAGKEIIVSIIQKKNPTEKREKREALAIARRRRHAFWPSPRLFQRHPGRI